ncbi:MAG: hypothetical protein Q4A82_05235 [Corynebacterium sp.]|nr:hypothetical protein [Corynebacterium sp.]
MMRDRKITLLMSLLLIIVFGVVSATIYHFRVDKPMFASVHRAVTEYRKVVDAAWSDPSCTLEHCSKSSKTIPGVPSTRAQLTEAERWNLDLRDSNLERRDNGDSPPPIHMSSKITLHEVMKNDDGSVTAIVDVYTVRDYGDGDSDTGATYVHQVELMPIDGGYVVMADKIVDMPNP